MAIPDPYRLEALNADKLHDVVDLDLWAFPAGTSLEAMREFPSPLTWDRAFGVRREGAVGLAAMHGAYPLRVYPVPGAEISCGWLTWVAVHPGHRRRGILRGMIEHHFADCLANGEAISGLFAAEPSIYGRFGYGMAAGQVSLTIPRGAALRPVAGSEKLDIDIAEWDAGIHGPIVARIHRAYASLPAGLGRPGWATRETDSLRAYRDADPPALREGREAMRVLFVRDSAGEEIAYGLFRRSSTWERGGPEGTVHVREAVALDAASAHRMWSILLDLDLTNRVKVSTLPLDDPIVSLLVDIRTVQPDYQDNTWIRIVDLPKALRERRYAADVDVVLEVTDSMLPDNAGRWRVQARAWEHATVEKTDADPDIVLDIRELGAAHLGSISLAGLAQAGLIEVRTPAQVGAASVAWSWPVAAGANWIF